MKKKIENCLGWSIIALVVVVEILSIFAGVSSVPIVEEYLDNAICSKYPALTMKEIRYVILLWNAFLVQLIFLAGHTLSCFFVDKNKEGNDDETQN